MNPFSFRGRIGRAKYWLSMLIAFGAALGSVMVFAAMNMPTGPGDHMFIVAVPLLILFVWLSAAAMVKRLRDAGWPAWARWVWALSPLPWLLATLELIEYIGPVIGFGLVAFIAIPGAVDTKEEAKTA